MRNEAANVPQFYRELRSVLQRMGRPYEIIVIDDGSTDDTFEQLAALQARDPQLRVIRFRRNFGQTAAFAAGFAHARGRLIVTSTATCRTIRATSRDGRLARAQGNDIVCGWRKDRKDTLVSRRVPSMIANKLISWATGVQLHDYGCSLKVFRAEVVKPLRLYGEMHRFLPAIASQFGVTIDEVVVNHRAAPARHSKYGLSRTMRVVLDLRPSSSCSATRRGRCRSSGCSGLAGGARRADHWLCSAYVRLFGTQASPIGRCCCSA